MNEIELAVNMIKTQALKNLEKWGKQDLKTLALAISEESGEIARAVLQAEFEDGDPRDIYNEAIDLGALCIQMFLCPIDILNETAREGKEE